MQLKIHPKILLQISLAFSGHDTVSSFSNEAKKNAHQAILTNLLLLTILPYGVTILTYGYFR